MNTFFDSLLRPYWHVGEGGAAVEEVEDADCHDDGDAGDGHHGSQVDAWNDKGEYVRQIPQSRA